MKLIDLTCPKCSGKLKPDFENKEAYCDYCGAHFLIDDEKAIPDEINVKVTLEKDEDTFVPIAPVQASPPVKKRKTWLWVLGWIFVFPLPLTLILIHKENLNPGIKYPIIVAAWLVYLWFIATSAADGSSSSAVSVRNVYAAEEISIDTEK